MGAAAKAAPRRTAARARVSPPSTAPRSPLLGAAALARLQRSVGNQAVGRLLAGRHVQRKPSKVAVPQGVFEAEHYEALKTEQPEHRVGAGIILTFTPTFAETGRIGLVQTIAHNAGPMQVDTRPVSKTRSKEPKPGADNPWRETLVTDSPVYAALGHADRPPKAGGPKALADTPNPKETASQWETPAHVGAEAKASGAYTHDVGKVNPSIDFKVQTGEVFASGDAAAPAALTDIPGFAARSDAATKPWTWSARVQALVLSGKSAGTYLGEVRWGWTYTPPGASGQVKPAELAPEEIAWVNNGDPSPEFKQAAFEWNRQEVLDPDSDKKVDLAQLPLPQESLAGLATASYNRTLGQLSAKWPKAFDDEVERILSVHEKSASRDLSPSERAFLTELQDRLRRLAVDRPKQIRSAEGHHQDAVDDSLAADVQAVRRKRWDDLKACKAKEAEFPGRVEALLKRT